MTDGFSRCLAYDVVAEKLPYRAFETLWDPWIWIKPTTSDASCDGDSTLKPKTALTNGTRQPL